MEVGKLAIEINTINSLHVGIKVNINGNNLYTYLIQNLFQKLLECNKQ